jgi:hypothetical protein
MEGGGWKKPEGRQGNVCQENSPENAFLIPLTNIPLTMELSWKRRTCPNPFLRALWPPREKTFARLRDAEGMRQKIAEGTAAKYAKYARGGPPLFAFFPQMLPVSAPSLDHSRKEPRPRTSGEWSQ